MKKLKLEKFVKEIRRVKLTLFIKFSLFNGLQKRTEEKIRKNVLVLLHTWELLHGNYIKDEIGQLRTHTSSTLKSHSIFTTIVVSLPRDYETIYNSKLVYNNAIITLHYT